MTWRQRWQGAGTHGPLERAQGQEEREWVRKKKLAIDRTHAAARDAMNRCQLIDQRIKSFIENELPTIQQQEQDEFKEMEGLDVGQNEGEAGEDQDSQPVSQQEEPESQSAERLGEEEGSRRANKRVRLEKQDRSTN